VYEQPETFVQTGHDVIERQVACATRREFEGEWDAIESLANRHSVRVITLD
jgi:hypothetical protein